MTQRTLAALIALPLVLALLVLSWVVPLPYTVYSPGPTVDVLGEYDGRPIVRVEGHRSYPTDGQIRLTTVSETTKDADLSLWQLVTAWTDRDNAVVPLEVAHPDADLTPEEEKEQSVQQMATSQEVAIAAALHELDYDIARPAVAGVEAKGPSAGTLKAEDVILRVNGRSVRTADQVVKAVQGAPAGMDVTLVVKRGQQRRSVTITPATQDGKPRIGISVGETYDFPFAVRLNIDPNIGGPSAGLMMALSVYDTLTTGPLTAGEEIAGTGTITYEGAVGPIGGIQQKIAGAASAGAELFLVPTDNCTDVAGVDPGDMRLVEVTTMEDAISSIESWTADHDARLPTCAADQQAATAGGADR